MGSVSSEEEDGSASLFVLEGVKIRLKERLFLGRTGEEGIVEREGSEEHSRAGVVLRD